MAIPSQDTPFHVLAARYLGQIAALCRSQAMERQVVKGKATDGDFSVIIGFVAEPGEEEAPTAAEPVASRGQMPAPTDDDAGPES